MKKPSGIHEQKRWRKERNAYLVVSQKANWKNNVKKTLSAAFSHTAKSKSKLFFFF